MSDERKTMKSKDEILNLAPDELKEKLLAGLRDQDDTQSRLAIIKDIAPT